MNHLITREMVEARLEKLRADLDSAQQAAESATRLVVALDGAVQDCTWFLSQIDAGADPPRMSTQED